LKALMVASSINTKS